jgi:hypothetical protein
VYAFGIVLWEVYSHSRAYNAEKNFTLLQLITAIESGMRPNIPKNWPKLYKNLAEACWHSNPKIRPEFKHVVLVLENKDPDLANIRDGEEDEEEGDRVILEGEEEEGNVTVQ